ncbi:MAG: DNA recombination protein RmuC [Candidatus Omnitrophica bacterium]|nr:DNA recombination protein RmuC [Candidatus Omnitrophota bacterium]MDD5488884.1 DNA recombination protein RmuC [Candidatus Omnitrophota bacterium]
MQTLLILIILLLITLIILIAVLFIKVMKGGSSREHVETVLHKSFLDFSDNVRKTMDDTRKEVESSKDVISSNALSTLKNISDMNKAIKELLQQQEKAQELGQSLEYLLQTPKLRGSYGETVLEEMLDRILPKGIWESQYNIDGGEKVDAVIKFKDVVIPIDAKFPRDDYQKYLSAKSPAEKKTHWSNYEKALKTQINSIRDKYIKPGKGTTEFALLFIPSESIYYETIAEKNHLGDPCLINEYATKQKVIPVSPNTFYAFLNVIILGVRNIEIAKNARKLQAILAKVERDFGLFYQNFELIGKSIAKAGSAYSAGEDQVNRFKRNLDAALKFDNQLGADAPDNGEKYTELG